MLRGILVMVATAATWMDSSDKFSVVEGTIIVFYMLSLNVVNFIEYIV